MTMMEIEGRFLQFVAVLSGTLCAISDGMQYAWTAPIVPILQRPDSPIPITHTDVVWLESIYMIGGMAGIPFIIYSVERFGRKATILIGTVQHIVSWIMKAFAPSVEYFYVARFISGFAANVDFVAAPMYISEIADKKVRGFLGSSIYVMMLVGILIIYSVAPFASIPISSAVGCSFLVVQLFVFPFMPESPYYLVSKGKIEAAKKSLQKLRATRKNIDKELEEILSMVNKRQSEKEKRSYADLFRIRKNRRAVLIVTTLNCAQHFSSYSVILMNLHSILNDAGSLLSSSNAAIIFSALMLGAALSSSILVDRAGRKLLLCVSSCLTGLSILSLAMYFAIKNSGHDVAGYSWVPPASAMCYAVFFKCGMGLIPIVLTAELFPSSVKAMGMATASAMYSVSSVVSIYLYQFLSDQFGMHVPFFIFGFSCFLAAFFTIYFIPETKGKTLAEIQLILSSTKSLSTAIRDIKPGSPEYADLLLKVQQESTA